MEGPRKDLSVARLSPPGHTEDSAEGSGRLTQLGPSQACLCSLRLLCPPLSTLV